MRFTTFQNGAERCARICAIALGVSIPISVAFDNIFLALILVSCVAAAGYRAKLGSALRNPVALAAFALFALLVVGTTYGSGYTDEGIDMLGKYLDLAFVPIFVYLFRDEQTRHRAWIALAVALALTLVISYLARFGVISDNLLVMGDRENPVVFKQYLTQSVMMAFATLLFSQLARATPLISRRYLWSALAIFSAINVALMSLGRTGQVILVALLFYLAHTIWPRRTALVTAVGVAVVIGALIFSAGAINSRFSQALEEWNNWRPGETAQTSVGQRLEFYLNSLEIMRKHPLVGTGTGSFSKEYADQVAGTSMTATINPHNEYLNMAVQLGAIGMFALLYLFFCEWRLAPLLPTEHERHLARGVVITFAIGCLFNSLLMDHTEGLWFAWMTGLLFAGLQPQKTGASAR
ncbi:MAG TPA: O-antigen ligase family protein [Burkholderiales bacterium]|jgi:putative effector of murein hydrolase LrgA (UPF0299 family)|nr:O-antigen ligase family protein [Burkholderiales bacterium]